MEVLVEREKCTYLRRLGPFRPEQRGRLVILLFDVEMYNKSSSSSRPRDRRTDRSHSCEKLWITVLLSVLLKAIKVFFLPLLRPCLLLLWSHGGSPVRASG